MGRWRSRLVVKSLSEVDVVWVPVVITLAQTHHIVQWGAREIVVCVHAPIYFTMIFTTSLLLLIDKFANAVLTPILELHTLMWYTLLSSLQLWLYIITLGGFSSYVALATEEVSHIWTIIVLKAYYWRHPCFLPIVCIYSASLVIRTPSILRLFG